MIYTPKRRQDSVLKILLNNFFKIWLKSLVFLAQKPQTKINKTVFCQHSSDYFHFSPLHQKEIGSGSLLCHYKFLKPSKSLPQKSNHDFTETYPYI